MAPTPSALASMCISVRRSGSNIASTSRVVSLSLIVLNDRCSASSHSKVCLSWRSRAAKTKIPKNISPLEGEIGIRQRTRPTPLHLLARRNTGTASPSPGAKRLDSGASSPSPGAKRLDSGASSPSAGARHPRSGASSPSPGAKRLDLGTSLPSAGAQRPRYGASSPTPDAKRHSSGAVSPSQNVKRSDSGASSTLHNAPPQKPRSVRITSDTPLRRLPTQQRSQGGTKLEPSPTTGGTTERQPASPIILSLSDESHGQPKTPQPREPSPDGRIPWWLPTGILPAYRSVETQTEELPATECYLIKTINFIGKNLTSHSPFLPP
ncbi:serine/arginine repetitive matrix protein 2-like [Polyergus mexicanus]|uniref:serine/arginine repetitive matrix protein 2-like n=1 Tax=Polyergus mexicanus TaxID=615972 RepID=UPI0038B4C20C